MSSVGTPLGRYRLLAELGHGGMADVYLASMGGAGGFQKLLVVKIARDNDDPTALQMFLDEARLAARLSHPNVVQTYEIGEENGRQYMVMEYLDGPSLHRLGRRAQIKGGIPLRMTISILSQVLEGLEYAHTLKDYDGEPLRVVHRDLSPGNVMVTVQGVCKVLDFGIAKTSDSRIQTQAGFYRGKLHYMAPEQARSEAVDFRADIFSVGIILAEAAMGRQFWGGQTDPMIAAKLVHGELPAMEAGAIDERLLEICSQALAPRKEDRFTSAAEFKVMLDWFLDKTGGAITQQGIADFVNPLVAADRQRIKTVLDQQMRSGGQVIASTLSGITLPSLTPATPSRHSTGETPIRPLHVENATPQAMGPPVPLPVLNPPTPALAAPLPKLDMSVRGQSLNAASGSKKWIVGAGLSAVVAVVVAVGLFTQKPTVVPVPVPTPVVIAAPPPPAPAGKAPQVAVAPPLPQLTSVDINVTPLAARLVLDGKELGASPWAGKLPRDSAAHTLSIEADGYQPYTTQVNLERDVSLRLSLDRLPPAAVRRVERRPGKGGRPAPIAEEQPKPLQELKPAVPAKGNRNSLDTDVFEGDKKRSIDQENPWKE